MNELLILVAIAVAVPLATFALLPRIAEKALKSKSDPRVNLRCRECLESYDADCSSACSLPA